MDYNNERLYPYEFLDFLIPVIFIFQRTTGSKTTLAHIKSGKNSSKTYERQKVQEINDHSSVIIEAAKFMLVVKKNVLKGRKALYRKCFII